MPRPRTAGDYQDGITAASRSGLAEVMTALGAYRDSLVLISGWASFLILEQMGDHGTSGFVHVGSIDIDFVVDPGLVNAATYATILELLLDLGFTASGDSLFQLEKTIRSQRDGQDYMLRVDFLTPRPLTGQGRARRHRQVQRDLKARTLEGVVVALTHWFWYDLEAQLPDGASARVRLKVANLIASLALKGIAIGERYAEKDAYDIYALCAHTRGGPQIVAAALKPFMDEQPVRAGLGSIAQKFRALDAEGPTWVAKFLGGGDAETEARVRQDAFMRVREVCRLLGVVAR